MAKHEYEYTVHGDDYRYTFVSSIVDQPWWIAEEAADDFRHEHDGWECSWPIVFEIFRKDESLGRFSVECEHVPTFHAYKIEKDAAA